MFIIMARYNFLDKKYSLEEIAQKYGITRERVRQLELIILEKLKRASKIKEINELVKKEGNNLSLTYKI